MAGIGDSRSMLNQLPLPGFDTPPMQTPTDRLLLALFPETTAASQIALLAKDVAGKSALRGAPLRTERFHVTLFHLGDYFGLPQGVVDAAQEAAAALDFPAFDVAFDRVESFYRKSGAQPLVLRGGDGLAALRTFREALGASMMKAGLGRSAKSSFTPHVTLLYDDQSIGAQTVEPIGWTAHEFVLVHSLLNKTQYIPLARWPLRG